MHSYTITDAKMAEDVSEVIENALNLIVTTSDRSGNMKKDLKQTIFDTVSTLGELYVQLKSSRDSKSQTISELERRVASMKSRAGSVQRRYG
jgi:chromosome condensin MukBEF ATPase and DNA-binding subunit MukB